MAALPTGNDIRSMLDPVPASHLQPAFDQAVGVLRRHGGLAPFRQPGHATPGEALGSTLAATLAAAGHAMTLLLPAFIASQNGTGQQDRERNAARRWRAAHGDRVQALPPVYLGDDLFACQPIADAITAAGGDFLLTATAARSRYQRVSGGRMRRATIVTIPHPTMYQTAM